MRAPGWLKTREKNVVACRSSESRRCVRGEEEELAFQYVPEFGEEIQEFCLSFPGVPRHCSTAANGLCLWPTVQQGQAKAPPGRPILPSCESTWCKSYNLLSMPL